MIKTYKPLSDSTLMGMTKKELISNLRVAEHNYFAAKETFENHIKEVEKNYKYVVHSHWIFKDIYRDCEGTLHSMFKTSCCGYDSEDKYNYCPNCGAKMDGEEE